MEFRTEIKPLYGVAGTIRHGDPIMMLGSCFTDNIGRCLRDELFEVEVNPFGPIYNPLSLLRGVETLVNKRHITAEELIENEGRYHSFIFHSRYSASGNPQDVCAGMNSQIDRAADVLEKCSVLILTLGTNKVYTLKSTGETVANCHEPPASVFESYPLTIDETIDALEKLYLTFRTVNHSGRLIFTVSPLRYLGDGAHAGQVAKATLLLAVDALIAAHPDEVGYFPSYEIMMDDLRDYRFYAEDMRHPSDVAVKYIYEIFKASYFDEETKRIAAEASRLTRRLAHRSFSGFSPEEEAAKREMAEKFILTYPKLQSAYKRYTINGI